jgi:thiosulfate/3-mercaptopyruvate sulfurtransferase
MRKLKLGTLASLVFGILGVTGRAEQFPRPELLQTAAEVKQHLADNRYRILDIREAADYEAGHIPGAVRLDLPSWTKQSQHVAGLLDRDFWAAAVSHLGVDQQMRVVVYGADAASAARAWWLLTFVGVKHASLLDGGWPAWQQAGYPVAAEVPQIESRPFRPDFQRERLMDKTELLRGLENPKLQVLDARSRGEFTGELRAGARPGRVPRAVHLEWVEFLDQNGRFKQPGELKALLAKRGLTADAPLVSYCYSGGRASVAIFACELLGWPRAKNYYCGWQEWSADATAPAKTDAEASSLP